jgi:hypothetical protein
MATTVSSTGKFFLIVVALLFGLSGPALAKKKKGGKKGRPSAAKKVSGGKAAPEPPDDGDDGAEEAEAAPMKEEAPPPPRPKPKMVEDSDAEGGGSSAKRETTVAKKRSEDEPSAAGGPLALQFGVGGSALFRNATWIDNSAMALAPYKLSPGPQAALWLEAYPAAFATGGFAANIGIIGRLDYGFGVSSKTPAGAVLNTTFRSYHVGLKVRFPMGTFVPYVSAAYGAQTFAVNGGNVPAFEYKLIRPAVGTRIELSPAMDIDIAAGYVLVTDPGGVKAMYPNTAAYGIDVAASFGFRVTEMVGLRAGVDFRQYGITFGAPAAGQAAVTGGTDRYIAAWGGLEVVFGGSGEGGSASSGGDDDEEAAPKKKKAKKKVDEDAEGDEAGGEEE